MPVKQAKEQFITSSKLKYGEKYNSEDLMNLLIRLMATFIVKL